jgi:peptide deformylase
MAQLPLVIYPDPRLREECEPVERIDDQLRAFLDEMVETMHQSNGIGLAAPQVGSLIRAIVVDVGADETNTTPTRLYKLLNPEILASSGDIEMEEGCLSIPEVREVVRRPSTVTVKAIDENGQPLTIAADGLLAVCLQHEIDHLNGVLFIDRLSSIKRELIRSKLRKLRQQQPAGV